MGALTLKNFPFELRGWELEKINNIDLTDSFGSNIKISLNNKQIIQIEPSYAKKNSIWIHDKARLFFDGLIFNTNKKFNIKKTIKKFYKTIYLFELCNSKQFLLNYLIVVYENLGINNLCLLISFSQKFNFIKLKKSSNNNFNNNLESNYLLNQFNTSSFCLLINTNTRFEGSLLNLNFKQKLLKGNFKLFTLGSFTNLTFNLTFLGNSSIKALKSIVSGTHYICQNIIYSKNPFLVINSKLLKKKFNFIKLFQNFNDKITLNTLNSNMFEINSYWLYKPAKLNNADFINFSLFYFINLTTYNHKIINKIIKINTIYFNNYNNKPLIKKLFFNQNYYKQQNINKFIYIPTKTFLEIKEKFINNNGIIKYTNKLKSNNNNKSSWKFLRSLSNFIKKKINFINTNLKINLITKTNKLKNYNNLIYKTSTNLNKNIIKIINNNTNNFYINTKTIKIKKLKFLNNKINFWLNNFFINENDEISKNSLNMIKLSKIKKLEKTNFF